MKIIKIIIPCAFVITFILYMANFQAKTESGQHKTNIIQGVSGITGEKTWVLSGCENVKLPEYIIVYLERDELIVDMAKVAPDEDGRWMYSFAVPVRDKNGQEIIYMLREEQIENFKTEIDGYNIRNIYIPTETEIPTDSDRGFFLWISIMLFASMAAILSFYFQKTAKNKKGNKKYETNKI